MTSDKPNETYRQLSCFDEAEPSDASQNILRDDLVGASTLR